LEVKGKDVKISQKINLNEIQNETTEKVTIGENYIGHRFSQTIAQVGLNVQSLLKKVIHEDQKKNTNRILHIGFVQL